MSKEILIIGADSKVAKRFIEKYHDSYSMKVTRRSPAQEDEDTLKLDLSNSKSVARFTASQQHISFDAVLVFASVYDEDPDSSEEYLDRAEKDMKINVFSPLAILRKLNYNNNSTILLFGDAGTEVPKLNHSLYTISKTSLLPAARILASHLKDTTKVITLRLGPTLAPDSREDQAGFYEKNLFQVKNTSDGLVNYCNFLIQEENLGMTGAEIIYDSGAYLQR